MKNPSAEYISLHLIIFIISCMSFSNSNTSDFPCNAKLETRIKQAITNRAYWGTIKNNETELNLLLFPAESITCQKQYKGLTAQCIYRDFSRYLDWGIDDTCKLPSTIYHTLKAQYKQDLRTR